ncbi:unnamed protein product [Pipistrellus nathusii]|uniref:Uncharacterized protein n=1 Tax=Pipistrellus nathusii TaxID=59473 RepID=A0ABP0A401_PIPNA
MAADGTCGGRGRGAGEQEGGAGRRAGRMVGFTPGLPRPCSSSCSGGGGGGYDKRRRAAAAGAGDSTFKMAPAGLGTDVIGGVVSGRGRGRGEAGSGPAASWPRPFLSAGPPGPTVPSCAALGPALGTGDRGPGTGDLPSFGARCALLSAQLPGPGPPALAPVPDPGVAPLYRKSPRSQGFVRAWVF